MVNEWNEEVDDETTTLKALVTHAEQQKCNYSTAELLQWIGHLIPTSRNMAKIAEKRGKQKSMWVNGQQISSKYHCEDIRLRTVG